MRVTRGSFIGDRIKKRRTTCTRQQKEWEISAPILRRIIGSFSKDAFKVATTAAGLVATCHVSYQLEFVDLKGRHYYRTVCAETDEFHT